MRGSKFSSLPAPADVDIPRTRHGDWATIRTLLPYLWEYKGRVLAAPRAGLSDKELDKALKPLNAKSKGKLRRGNVHVIELPPGLDENTALRALKKDRRFKFVELDMAVAPSATVNDPSYTSSWALPKIQAPTAWDSATGTGVTIAILDTGVDSKHPDLAANMVAGWNFYDNNADTSDVHGHGTAVASIAAGAGFGGLGHSRLIVDHLPAYGQGRNA